jgi:hypothetical protein
VSINGSIFGSNAIIDKAVAGGIGQVCRDILLKANPVKCGPWNALAQYPFLKKLGSIQKE